MTPPRVYRDQLRECGRCGRWVPKDEAENTSTTPTHWRCLDVDRCANRRAPEYDENVVGDLRAEFRLEFLAACRTCGAHFTPQMFRLLPESPAPDLIAIPNEPLETISKRCCCGNRLVRAVRRVVLS